MSTVNAMNLLSAAEPLRPNITLIVVVSVLIGAGVYLLLERSLTRVLLGVVMIGNGVATLYMVVSGSARGAPIVGERPADEMSDALPQAFVLTAIVISLATVAFVMAMAYRYWRLTGSDDVPDDLEDALIQRLAERDEPSETYDTDVTSTTEAEEDPDEVDAMEAEVQARAEAALRHSAVEADVNAGSEPGPPAPQSTEPGPPMPATVEPGTDRPGEVDPSSPEVGSDAVGIPEPGTDEPGPVESPAPTADDDDPRDEEGGRR